MGLREHEMSEERLETWVDDFNKLPMADARDITRVWLRRIGHPTGGLKDLDKEGLCKRALEARRTFFGGPKHMHREGLSALEDAADKIAFANRLLAEVGVDVSECLVDSLGLLKQAVERATSQADELDEGESAG